MDRISAVEYIEYVEYDRPYYDDEYDALKVNAVRQSRFKILSIKKFTEMSEVFVECRMRINQHPLQLANTWKDNVLTRSSLTIRSLSQDSFSLTRRCSLTSRSLLQYVLPYHTFSPLQVALRICGRSAGATDGAIGQEALENKFTF